MRRYETTYILRPNLGEDQFSEIIARTNAIIESNGGAIINLERWGTRKLAYEINKETLGHYVYFDFAVPGTAVFEMERIFRIDDRVLRFLTIKLADAIDQESIARETERAAAAAVEKSASPEESESVATNLEDSEENDDQEADYSDED